MRTPVETRFSFEFFFFSLLILGAGFSHRESASPDPL
jgi:hypothetical protein